MNRRTAQGQPEITSLGVVEAEGLVRMSWRVLIVEDEFLIAFDWEAAFLDAGAQMVGPVRTLADALALPLTSFDAAVLDIELEDGSCHPFAVKLWQAGIPFVFATGYRRDDLPEGLESVPCLVKPFSADTLVYTLTARAAMLARPAALATSPCDERKLLRAGRPGSFDRRQGRTYSAASIWHGLRTVGRH